MRKIILFTESTCDLTPELLTKYDIKVIPLFVNFNEETYLDGININAKELYQKVSEKKILPKTAARGVHEYFQIYQDYINQGFDIVHISLGNNISSSYQNAYLARNELGDLSNHVYLIDGQNLSTGTSLLLLKASQMRAQGLSASEIETKIKELVPRVKTQFVVESLEYLHKGGRCSTTKRFLGAMLRIKPMIVMRGGILSVGKTIFGSIRKSLNIMFNQFLNDLPNIDPEFVFITHSSADKSAKYLFELLKANGVVEKIEHIYETEAGCVISSHCGEGTIGILYLMNQDVNTNDLNE